MNSKQGTSIAIMTVLLGAGLAGCIGGSQSAETWRQAGSSTVLPIAQAWAEEWGRPNGVDISVAGGGSGAGFEKFCRGELTISDASRPIKQSEVATCQAAGIEPFEIPVATDGLAVVVAKGNTFVDNLTTEELGRIWTADDSVRATRWSDLRAEWPDQAIELYGPGTDSGTYDYFVEAIVEPFDEARGIEGSSGTDAYTPSEDDNVLVTGVTSSQYALGYFGLAYAEENADKVRMVPIDDLDASNGDGAFLPTAANVESGKYAPLSRPIFMYTDGTPTGKLREYFLWGLGDEGQAIVEDVGYIRLPASTVSNLTAQMG